MSSGAEKAIKQFAWIALAEGWSYLILLFLAMPLKYWAGWPWAVKYVGWVHGVLFVAYLIALLWVWITARWPFWKVIVAFLASLIPFGTFWFVKKILAKLNIGIIFNFGLSIISSKILINFYVF